MIQFIHPRIRIALVIIVSFFVSALLMNYSVGESETSAPEIKVENIVADFAHSVSSSGTSIIASLQSIKLPSIGPVFSPNPDITQPPLEEPTSSPNENPDPTEMPEIPTSTPAFLPTDLPQLPNQPPINPTIPKVSQPPQQMPSSVPKPTKTPKPTAVPELPPITSDTRPGGSIAEILKEVEKRACVPYKLLMAERLEESGAWFNGMSATTTKMYNTYGWWRSADKGTVCAGLAYYTQSGLIPPDSTTALQQGSSCTNGVQPGAYDQKIMGLIQMSEWEEQTTRKNTTKTLPKNIDRRVLFDNALIFAWATKGRAGSSPQPSCSDWPAETVKLVAEKHYGACKYPGGNYCEEVWAKYKSIK